MDIPNDSAPEANAQAPSTAPVPLYWAALDKSELGEKLTTKVEALNAHALTGVIRNRTARSYQYYFGLDATGTSATSHVLRGGEAGELALMRVNESRSLVNALVNLITAPKIVWSPKVTNTDYRSVQEKELASAILEYYWSERNVNRHALLALEQAVVFTEAFVLLDWDTSGGEDYVGTDAGTVAKTGDAYFCNIPTWDVYRDPGKASWAEVDWQVVRLRRNKYTLAAQYPEHAHELIELASDADDLFREATSVFHQKVADESDDVTVFLFLHRPTAALPTGRKTLFLASGTVLNDEEQPTPALFRVAAGEFIGTPYGYSPFNEILGVQELMDSLESSIATNQTTFATANILVPMGSEIAPDDLVGGARIIYYPSESKPPEALKLTSTPPEVFTNLERLQRAQERLFGLNSVVRGEAPSKEMSGTALGVLSASALQQSSVINTSYLSFVESIGTALVQLVQENLSVPRKIAIAGKANASLVSDTEYTGESISRIKRVTVEIGNPLSQTAAGRIELAQSLLNLGLIKTPEQYLSVLMTGRLEPLTQSLTAELLLIRSENEALARGEPKQALILDDHMLHAREHRSVLASPEARQDPAVVQAVLTHIDEHEQLYSSAPPSTLMMMGMQPPPWLMGPPPGAEGEMPPGAPMPPPGEPGSGAPPPEAPPGSIPGGPTTPAPPEPPTNPNTGQPWNPIDGGGSLPR